MSAHKRTSMGRSQLRLRVLCVVVLGLRALIPTGYMFGAADGHSGIVLCPAGLYGTALMHHVPGHRHDGHSTAAAEQCPFALAGGAGLLTAAATPAEAFFLVLRPVRVDAVVSVPRLPPLRYHAPRGPPSLA